MATVSNPNLESEEVVTTKGLNLRDGPGKTYKVLLVLPKFAIMWPQQKIPSWVNGKPLTQEGKVAEWVKMTILTPVGAEEKTAQVTGYCWIGTESEPTFVTVAQ
jgi:hypothetical protein